MTDEGTSSDTLRERLEAADRERPLKRSAERHVIAEDAIEYAAQLESRVYELSHMATSSLALEETRAERDRLLSWAEDAIRALDDLGACTDPDCSDCPNVLPRGIQLRDEAEGDNQEADEEGEGRLHELLWWCLRGDSEPRSDCNRGDDQEDDKG